MKVSGSKRVKRLKRALVTLASTTLMVGLIVPATSAAAAGGASFWVSPTGSDSNPGTLSQPFLTLDKARLAVRALAPTMGGTIQVYLRGGTYHQTGPVAFDPGDSGQNGFNVNYSSWNGETPIISGGRELTGWTKIVASSIDIWEAHVPVGFQTRDVYIDGQRAQRTRSLGGLEPDAGNASTFGSLWAPSQVTQTSTGYVVNDVAPQSWTAGADLVWSGVGANGTNGWAEPRCPIASIAADPSDAAKSVITVAQPCYKNVTTQKNVSAFAVRLPSAVEGLFANNDFRTQMAPGQWMYSPPDQAIFYMPYAWQDMSTVTGVAGQAEQLITLTGTPTNPVHNITFDGITFSDTTWLGPSAPTGFAETQANEFQLGSSCLPEDCPKSRPPGVIDLKSTTNIAIGGITVEHAGGAAVRFWGGAHTNSLSHSTITDIGANCVEIGDTDNPNPATDAERDKGTIISYNTISSCADVYRGGVGIWAGYVADTTILNNEVSNTPYSAISVGWGWGAKATYMANNRVAFNNIHDTMTAAPNGLVDGGAIYLNGYTATSSGVAGDRSVVSDNYIHNQSRSIAAIYLDSGASRWDITNNVIERSNVSYWYTLGGTYDAVYGNYTDTQPGRISNGSPTNSIGTNTTGISTWPAAANTIKANAGP